ncbi:MAG: cation-translocating P-type ATPase [Clostridiales bacterium]|nr:cation-translocating P-type ATPase [Clostridiales bacterium]
MIWHSEDIQNVLETLQTDSRDGLTPEQAAKRLESVGLNQPAGKPSPSFFRCLPGQLKNAMTLILSAAAAVSLGFGIYRALQGEGAHWIEPSLVLLIVLAGAAFGAVRESRAAASLQTLNRLSVPSARVIRGGEIRGVEHAVISSLELTPGDIIEMEAGDLIPADCRLLHTDSFQCDESSLIGEPVLADKDADAAADDIAPLGERRNMAYAGCVAVRGRARAVVVETGMNTERGKAALLLEKGEGAETPLQQKLGQLGRLLSLPVPVICAAVVLTGLLNHQLIPDILLTAVSLAAVVLPQGLSATAVPALAAGARRMAAKNAVVRRLSAVETLNNVSVICTDKTGVLTRNRMTVTCLYAGNRLIPVGRDTPLSAGGEALLRLTALCTGGGANAAGGKERRPDNATEAAILSCALQNGMDPRLLRSEHPCLGEIPFDSGRRLMTTVNLIEGKHVVIVKGAPDVLLPLCSAGNIQAAEKAHEEMTGQALRVLAVGYRYLEEPPLEYLPEQLERDLSFAGLVGLADSPRPDTAEAIRLCGDAGIRTVMITGDHPAAAAAAARQLGLLREGEEVMDSPRLAVMSDSDLSEHIRDYPVYARATPADKLRLLKAWQRTGETVVMTGDGIDDAPALQSADIGCAMGASGADVARSAADMTLIDDHFATIVASVREGRGVHDNIFKTVRFLLASRLGILLVFLLSMLLCQGGLLPPAQLLWVSLAAGALPALVLERGSAEEGAMRRDAHPFGRWTAVLWQGGLIALLTLAACFAGSRLLDGRSPALGETMALATLAFSQLVYAFELRLSRSLFRTGPRLNRYMMAVFAVSLLLTLAVLLFPPLQLLFGTIPMTGAAWGIVAGLSLVPLPVLEAARGLSALRRRKDSRK